MEQVLTDEEIAELLKELDKKPKLSFHLKMLVYKIKRWIKYGNRKIIFD